MGHLQYRDGDWYLHASMRKEEEDTKPDTEHRTVLGVDLGVNNIAVASTGRFWSANEFNHWNREYEKRRGSLGLCGSREAHENIERIGRKAEGRFTIYLHTVANETILRGGRERVFAHRVRGPNPHQGEHSQCDVATSMGVPTAVRVRRVQSRRTWPGGRAGQPAQHVEAMLDVGLPTTRIATRSRSSASGVGTKPRGLQRFEEYRLAVSPSSAKRRRWRRTRRRALESRDAEREWGLRAPCLNRGIERESTRKPHPQRARRVFGPRAK